MLLKSNSFQIQDATYNLISANRTLSIPNPTRLTSSNTTIFVGNIAVPAPDPDSWSNFYIKKRKLDDILANYHVNGRQITTGVDSDHPVIYNWVANSLVRDSDPKAGDQIGLGQVRNEANDYQYLYFNLYGDNLSNVTMFHPNGLQVGVNQTDGSVSFYKQKNLDPENGRFELKYVGPLPDYIESLPND